MYNKYCKNCGDPSYGKPLCYDCYLEYIEEREFEEDNSEDEYFYDEDFDDEDEFEEESCIICGSYSNGYEYCYNCYQNIIKKNNKKNVFTTFISKIFTRENDKITLCKMCFKPSEGKEYCYACYKKTQTSKRIQTSKERYSSNNKYKCKNGLIVKSKSERIISDFLTDHNIEHYYEKAISIDSHKEHDIFPDFYIPGIITFEGRIIKNIYLEHWGYDEKSKNYSKYKAQNEYKLKIYKKMNLTVVYTTEDDMINPEFSLREKLISIKEHKINDWPG